MWFGVSSIPSNKDFQINNALQLFLKKGVDNCQNISKNKTYNRISKKYEYKTLKYLWKKKRKHGNYPKRKYISLQTKSFFFQFYLGSFSIRQYPKYSYIVPLTWLPNAQIFPQFGRNLQWNFPMIKAVQRIVQINVQRILSSGYHNPSFHKDRSLK